jgi:hypothetical protein
MVTGGLGLCNTSVDLSWGFRYYKPVLVSPSPTFARVPHGTRAGPGLGADDAIVQCFVPGISGYICRRMRHQQ